MNKSYSLVAVMIFAIHAVAFSQYDSTIRLNEYNNTAFYKYFESINTLKKSTIQHLRHSYICWAHFEINQEGGIQNFDLIEVPEAPLPDTARKYIGDIFKTTTGKWSFPANCTIKSRKLFFFIQLLKAEQTIEQRAEDIASTFEFSIVGLTDMARRKGYDISKYCILPLSY